MEAALSSDKIKSAEDLGIVKNVKAILKSPEAWCYILADCCMVGLIYAGGIVSQLVLQTDPNWRLPITVSGLIPSANNFSSMTAYIVVPLIIARVFKKNYDKGYRIAAIACGVAQPFLYYTIYSSYNLDLAIKLMVVSGILFGLAVTAPKVLFLSTPEVSGPRAATGMGIYITIQRVFQTVVSGIAAAAIAMNPDNSAMTLANMYILFGLSPIFLALGWFFNKRRAKNVETQDSMVQS